MSIIFSFGAIGAGYASWRGNIHSNTSMTTGNLRVDAVVKEGRVYSNDGEYLDITTRNRGIVVDGQVYPSFKYDFGIEIIDKGTVPAVLGNIKELNNDRDVAQLEERGSFPNANLHVGEKARGLLNLNLYPGNSRLATMGDISRHSTIYQPLDESIEQEIERLQHEIDMLQEKIQEYCNMEEELRFQYNVIFEQGI